MGLYLRATSIVILMLLLLQSNLINYCYRRSFLSRPEPKRDDTLSDEPSTPCCMGVPCHCDLTSIVNTEKSTAFRWTRDICLLVSTGILKFKRKKFMLKGKFNETKSWRMKLWLSLTKRHLGNKAFHVLVVESEKICVCVLI